MASGRPDIRSDMPDAMVDVADPAQPKLDDLTTTYRSHPLHIEDCRQAGQRAKLESGEEYRFVSLKLLALEFGNRL